MVQITVTFNRISKMPVCEHGLVEPFSKCWRPGQKETEYCSVNTEEQKGKDWVNTLVERGWVVYHTDLFVTYLYRLPEAQ